MINNEGRKWIYNKLQGHYKRELHFQGLDVPFYLSTLKYCLAISNTFSKLETNLESYQMNDCLDFVRKGKSKKDYLYFSYPCFSFQAESLYKCWDDILDIQKKSGEDLQKAIEYQRNLLFIEDIDEENWDNSVLDVNRSSYGNKPNLNIQRNPVVGDTIQLEEERRVFPISIDFKYEYNSFRRKVILECERLTGKKGSPKKTKDILFVQTDIISFFHNLQILPLADFISEKYPKAKSLVKYLRLLKTKYNYDELPIGWILSRFVANIVLHEFHALFQKYLPRNLKSNLSKLNFKVDAKESVDLSKKWDVELKHTISYVDDFIFLLTIPPNSKGVYEIVADTLLKEASNLLNQAIKGNKTLDFHGLGAEKTKYQTFNKENVTTLKTNFAFFNTADDYLFEDPDIKAKVDEVLLPIDNDITLNSSQQFHRNLKGLQKLVISNREFKEKEVSDLLAQVKIKIEKTGSRYIKSVFGLLRLLMLSDLSEKQKKEIRGKEIKELFKKCKKNHDYSSEWIKFFNGYFNFLDSIDYEDIDNFFNLLNDAAKGMGQRSFDDRMLFRLMRNEYIYKCIMAAPKKHSLKNKTLSEIKRGIKKQMLLNLSCQRERSIYVSCEVIRPKNTKNKTLKHIDLSWIGMVLSRLLFKKFEVDVDWIFSIINKTKDNAKDELLDYGLSRLAIGILPLSNESNRKKFVKKAQTTRVKYDKFWKVADFLSKEQNYLSQYYERNEKSRIKRIIDNFENQKKDLIYSLIKPLFNSDQYRLMSYLIVNRFNTKDELIKYILNASLKLETSHLAPWSVLPIAFQKTGIAISLILKEMFELPIDSSKTASNLKNKILGKLKTAIQNISPPKIEKYLDSERFGAIQVNLDLIFDKLKNEKFQKNEELEKNGELKKNGKLKKKPLKVTIAPLGIDLNLSLDFEDGFKFKTDQAKLIDLGIRGAIDEAVRQGSSILLFPELCLPRNNLNSYLRLASRNDIVLIAGLEYFTDFKKNAFNSTIISVPVKRSVNPGGRSFIAFEQIKNFPSAEECHHLKKAGFQYQNGNGIFIFKSASWGDFSVLTCSDFLSLGLRWILQKEVQSVFVPAQNTDSVTYDHISETCIRDLHCIAVVCNNPEMGGSHCYAPYYDRRRRQLFKKVGISQPEYHTFEIEPSQFRSTQQEANPIEPFRDPDNRHDNKWGDYTTFKQLPPDWNFW